MTRAEPLSTPQPPGAAAEHACAVRPVGSGPSLPVVAVSVDVVLLTLREGRLCVLATRRDHPPYQDAWALPGGFVGPDEDLDTSARRQLAEETGVRATGHLEQLRTYGDPGRDPRTRVVSVSYLALLPNLPAPRSPGNAPPARWWPVEDLGSPGGPTLAFDHPRIVADGVERARAKLEYTPLAAAFCEESFTLADLRRVYEAAWGVILDAPNFRRKVLSTPGFVVPVGRREAPPGGGRPAELYRRGSATALHPPLLRTPAPARLRPSPPPAACREAASQPQSRGRPVGRSTPRRGGAAKPGTPAA